MRSKETRDFQTMDNAFLNQLTEDMYKMPRKIALVAVTKYVGIDETNEVIRAGVSAIGENRIEDAEKKFPDLLPVDSTDSTSSPQSGSSQVEKHFIGQIQSRKIKRIVELFDVIQSVGSIEHLQKIEDEAIKQRRDTRVLLQFNISEEKQKSGFNRNEIEKITTAISTIHRVKIIGVMGMASQTSDEDIVRKQFQLLKSIRDELHATYPTITELSMGMSDDYKIALEEGATMLRIGRALFRD